MAFAILGWGSLVWDPRELPIAGTWRAGGPVLPIEFSRVSSDGRLTLVIDERHGEPVQTRYALSPRTEMAQVVLDLQLREGTIERNIGLWSTRDNVIHSRVDSLQQVMRNWAAETKMDAVVWTDLPSNFEERTGTPFSVEAAEVYLRGLRGATADNAKRYIVNAPGEVSTPLRRQLAESGWL